LESFIYCNHVLDVKQSLQNNNYNKMLADLSSTQVPPFAFISDCAIQPAIDT